MADWTPRPARGYSWPSFKEGNTASLRHGVFSERTVDPVARQLAAGLVAERPDLVAHPEVVAAWSRAEARCLLLADYLAEHPPHTKKGEAAMNLAYKFERLADQLRQRLGLDPRSEAELYRLRADATVAAVDLEAVREQGRRALAG